MEKNTSNLHKAEELYSSNKIPVRFNEVPILQKLEILKQLQKQPGTGVAGRLKELMASVEALMEYNKQVNIHRLMEEKKPRNCTS